MKKNIWSLFFVVITSCFLLSGCGNGVKTYKKALQYAQDGEYIKAEEGFKDAIRQNKERAEFYIAYGMTLNKMGQPEKAMKQFEKAHQETKNTIADENNKQVYYGEAISYYQLSEYEKSLEYCEKALDISRLPSMNSNIYCSKGAVLEILGQQEAALKLYKKAVSLDKENWGAYLKKASLEEKLDITEEAVKEYQIVIDNADKQKYNAYFKLYHLYLSHSQDSAADKLLSQLIKEKDDSAYAVCQKGWALHLQGEEEQAKKLWTDAFNKGNPEGSFFLGMMEMMEKTPDYDKALDYFENYVSAENAQYRATAYNELCICAMQSENLSQAVSYLENGLKYADDDNRKVLWKNQVILYEKQGEYQKAEKVAKQYLKNFSKDKAMKKELHFIETRIKAKEALDLKKENMDGGNLTLQNDKYLDNAEISEDENTDAEDSGKEKNDSDGSDEDVVQGKSTIIEENALSQDPEGTREPVETNAEEATAAPSEDVVESQESAQ